MRGATFPAGVGAGQLGWLVGEAPEQPQNAQAKPCTALPLTLSALLGQMDVPDQIVVADDGSSDDTPGAMLRLYGLTSPALGEMSPASSTQPTLRWPGQSHGGKATALNAAMVQMDTDTVLTVDVDTLLEHDAIDAVRRAFSDEPAPVAATSVLAPVWWLTLGRRLFSWFKTCEYLRNFLLRYAWIQVGSLLLILGAFAGFKRCSLVEVGDFLQMQYGYRDMVGDRR